MRDPLAVPDGELLTHSPRGRFGSTKPHHRADAPALSDRPGGDPALAPREAAVVAGRRASMRVVDRPPSGRWASCWPCLPGGAGGGGRCRAASCVRRSPRLRTGESKRSRQCSLPCVSLSRCCSLQHGAAVGSRVASRRLTHSDVLALRALRSGAGPPAAAEDRSIAAAEGGLGGGCGAAVVVAGGPARPPATRAGEGAWVANLLEERACHHPVEAGNALMGPTSGVLRLCDGGLEPLGLEGHSVTALHASRDALLAGTYGDGLFRGVDGGQSWERIEAGLAASTFRFLSAELAGTEPARVYRSADGGRSWQELEGITRIPGHERWSLPYSPRAGAARNAYVSGDRLLVAAEVAGLLRSEDGGRSWVCEPVAGDEDVHHVTAHPRIPTVSTSRSAAPRSTSGEAATEASPARATAARPGRSSRP